jgi:gliding motility-associated-like protein
MEITPAHKSNNSFQRFAIGLGMLFSLLFATYYDAKASHVVGSDITYKCTATPGIWEITCVLYRDCNGIPISNCTGGCGSSCTVSVQMFGADPGCEGTPVGAGSVVCTLDNVRDVDANPACPTAKNVCTLMGCVTAGTFNPSIERYEFKGTVNLGSSSGIPSNCCNVRFSFQECCRNGIIANSIPGNFYTEATINRCLSLTPCNSSPELTNDPYAIICANENFVFNNGAQDPDFDSVAYEFTPSLEGRNSPVTYNAPFAANKPMPWTGVWNGSFPAGISCDPNTGDIMFKPGNAGSQDFVGVMAVKMTQWKLINGIMQIVGTTRRDLQMYVRPTCPPNNPPYLTTDPPNAGNPNSPKTNWEVCAGEQLCFTVSARDQDFNPPLRSDTTTLTWNRSLATLGATFVPAYNPLTRRLQPPLGTGPRQDSFLFCWQPGDQYASNTPYYFTVTGKDDRCPIPGRATRAFSIKVFGRADLSITKTNLACGRWKVAYTNNNIKRPPTSVIWNISSVPGDFGMTQSPYVSVSPTPPTYFFSQGGQYLVVLTANTVGPNNVPCTRVFYDTITVDTPIKVFKRDTFTCIGNTVQITAQARYGRPGIYTYRWFNTIRDTALTPLNAPFFTNPNYTVAPTLSRYYTVQARDQDGCRAHDSIRVIVKQLPVPTLIDSTRICFGDTFTLDPGNNGGNVRSFAWNTGDTSQIIMRSDSGRYVVTLTDTFNCVKRDTLSLFVNRKIIPRAGLDTAICFKDTATLRGLGGYQYQWRNLATNTIVSPKSYTPNIQVSPPGAATPITYNYEVRAYLSYPDTTLKYLECSATDTVELTVRPLPILTRPASTQSCRNEGLVFLPGFGTNQGGAGNVSVWSYPQAPGAVITNSQIRIDSLKNVPSKDSNTAVFFNNWIQYKYTAPLSFGGCTSYDSANVRIYARPAVNAGPTVVWCENGGLFNISSNPAFVYVPRVAPPEGAELWTGTGIISTGSNPVRYFFNPLAPGVVKGPGTFNVVNYEFTRTYNVTPTADFATLSCVQNDTVQFRVIDAPELNAGNDLTICKNSTLLMLSDTAKPTINGNPINPAVRVGYWTAAAPNAILNNTAIQDSQSFLATHNNVSIATGTSSVAYKLYYSDISTGCLVRDSITLTVGRVPSVNVVYNDKVADSFYVCKTNTVLFRVKATNANGVWGEPANVTARTTTTYSGTPAFGVNPGAGGGNPQAIFDANLAAPGGYPLSVRYKDNTVVAGNGCFATATNFIHVLKEPTIGTITAAPICTYDTMAAASVNPAPDTPFNYTWTTAGDGSFYTNDTSNVNYKVGAADKSLGQTILTVTTSKRILEANGDVCPIVSTSAPLFIYQAPTAQIQAIDDRGCVPFTGKYIALPTGISGVSYNWEWENEPGIIDSDLDSITTRLMGSYDPSVNGTYKVRVVVSKTNGNTICLNRSNWLPMYARAIPVADFSVNPPTKETTIAKPFFDFTSQSSVLDNSALSYLWNLGKGPDFTKPQDRFSTEENPRNIEYPSDTACPKITLKVTTEFGCVDSTADSVCIRPDITVFIPNAFRPHNADGTGGSSVNCIEGEQDCNTVFKVAADGQLSIEIFIFNRWGQLVYQSTDAKEGWNGRINNGRENGTICPQDVYVYQVNATSFSGKAYKYSGSVTLLR